MQQIHSATGCTAQWPGSLLLLIIILALKNTLPLPGDFYKPIINRQTRGPDFDLYGLIFMLFGLKTGMAEFK